MECEPSHLSRQQTVHRAARRWSCVRHRGRYRELRSGVRGKISVHGGGFFEAGITNGITEGKAASTSYSQAFWSSPTIHYRRSVRSLWRRPPGLPRMSPRVMRTIFRIQLLRVAQTGSTSSMTTSLVPVDIALSSFPLLFTTPALRAVLSLRVIVCLHRFFRLSVACLCNTEPTSHQIGRDVSRIAERK